MSDYTLDLISTLGARADSGELVPFGWGGPLAGWTRRLRQHIETEGYGDAWAMPRGDWGFALDDVSADLPKPSAGCGCEGCQERMTLEQRVARQLIDAVARNSSLTKATWRHCSKCYAYSRRAAEWRDGLCTTCAGKK